MLKLYFKGQINEDLKHKKITIELVEKKSYDIPEELVNDVRKSLESNNIKCGTNLNKNKIIEIFNKQIEIFSKQIKFLEELEKKNLEKSKEKSIKYMLERLNNVDKNFIEFDKLLKTNKSNNRKILSIASELNDTINDVIDNIQTEIVNDNKIDRNIKILINEKKELTKLRYRNKVTNYDDKKSEIEKRINNFKLEKNLIKNKVYANVEIIKRVVDNLKESKRKLNETQGNKKQVYDKVLNLLYDRFKKKSAAALSEMKHAYRFYIFEHTKRAKFVSKTDFSELDDEFNKISLFYIPFRTGILNKIKYANLYNGQIIEEIDEDGMKLIVNKNLGPNGQMFYFSAPKYKNNQISFPDLVNYREKIFLNYNKFRKGKIGEKVLNKINNNLGVGYFSAELALDSFDQFRRLNYSNNGNNNTNERYNNKSLLQEIMRLD